MKKVISLFLVMAMMLAMLTVSFNASYSVSEKDEDGNALIWSGKDALAAYQEETGEEVETARVYFLMPNGMRGTEATEDHYVTITDYKQAVDPDTGEGLVDEEGNPVMEYAGEHEEIAIHEGDKAPSWYSDYNVLDGKHYAACYWWGGTADPEHNYSAGWCGYRAEIADYEQGIYYMDIPKDVTTIIWNNGVNGGMDSSLPVYYEAAQTVDTNSEGAYPGDYDTLIDGTPDEYSFDNCIYVIDPDQVDVNALTNKQTCGANWYNYYGNGCYGSYFDGGESGEFVSAEANCLNPDHFVNGVHVGYHDNVDPTEPAPTEHVHTPGEAVKENEVAASYKSEGSYDEVVYCTECGEEISREHKTTPKIQLSSDKVYFDAASSGWELGAKDKIFYYFFGGDIATDFWGGKKYTGTLVSDSDGLFEFDPAKKGITLNDGVQYKIIFGVAKGGTSWDSTRQTYDLLMTTDCLGHVAFCDGTKYENPADSTKETLAAFWYGMDATQYGPVLQISSIGNVIGTCPEEGKTPESIFTDFITVINDTTGTTALDNARKFVVDVNTKTEQKLIDDIGAGLRLTKQQVYDAFTTNNVETVWDGAVSTLPGDIVIPTEPAPTEPAPTEPAPTEPAPTEHVHTPGEPVRENEKAASCSEEGSYDEVIYCTECGEEISREHKTIEKTAHTLAFKPGKKATATADGWKSYFYCKECGKYFSDSTGAMELTWDQIVLHYVAPTEPQPTQPAPTQPAPTEPQPTEPVITGILGDIDNSGEIDILDVTIMQRVDIGAKTADATMLKLGDVNKDGIVNIIDATLVQRYLVGIESNGIGSKI